MVFDLSTINDIVQVFVTFIVIMDPFVSLPVLLSLTKGCSEKERTQVTDRAVQIAAGLLLIFYIFSTGIFDLLGISLATFRIAGGIILLILGIEGALGISFKKSQQSKDVHVAEVLIGTPLITGPGAITSVIVFNQTMGYMVTGIAAVLALLATWIVLRRASYIYNKIGERTVEVFSRIMGLLVMAIAIEFIVKGVATIITGI